MEKQFENVGVPEMAVRLSTPMAAIRSSRVAASRGNDMGGLLRGAADLKAFKRREDCFRFQSGKRSFIMFEIIQSRGFFHGSREDRGNSSSIQSLYR